MKSSKILVCWMMLFLWTAISNAAVIEEDEETTRTETMETEAATEPSSTEDLQVEPVKEPLKEAPVKKAPTKKKPDNRSKKLALIDKKIAKYEKQKSNGITFFWAGLGAEALAFLFYPSIDYKVENGRIREEKSGNASLYYVLLFGGSASVIAGSYMWWDGANGVQLWETRKMDLSMGIVLPKDLSCKNTIGVELRARF